MSADDASLVAILVTVAAVYIPFRYTAIARTRTERAIHTQRLLGAVYLGAIPLAVDLLLTGRSLADVGLRVGNVGSGAVFVAWFGALTVVVAMLTAPRQSARGKYPQIQVDGPWPARLVLANAATWGIYLLGYEILLRGVLLTSLARGMPEWPAIAVTTLAYTWAHLPKHPSETIGSIPLGLLFGWITLRTGSLWPVWIAHTVMGVANDVAILRFQRRTAEIRGPGPG